MTQYGIDPFDAEGGSNPGGDGWIMAELWGLDDAWDEATGTFNVNDERMVEARTPMPSSIGRWAPINLQGMRSVEGQGTWGGSFNAQVQAMLIEGYWHPVRPPRKAEVSELERCHLGAGARVPPWRQVPDL